MLPESSQPEEEATLPPRSPNVSQSTVSHPAPPSAGEPVAPLVAAPPIKRWTGELPGRFGRYHMEKLLGQGGMGAVYLAQDTQLNRPVAIKIPTLSQASEQMVQRFLREARAAAVLQHPNICPIFDIGQIDDTHYLCMAYIRGEPLSQRLRPGQTLSALDALEIVRKTALAMHVAHRKGIIHRDLKPANLMLDEQGEPVVMDFGLARMDSSFQLTKQGDVMGTPAYMPPEQLNGDVARMGPACDIYSLGVVLYELLTGRTPFQGDLISLAMQIETESPLPPTHRKAGLDPRVDAVCLKALAKKPEDRYASMLDFAQALALLTAKTPRPSSPPTGTVPLAGPVLTLRVEGTSFAYRPPTGLAVITIGRQKRKPGEPPESGNDLVLRVAGNDALSARISRRHLEIHRQGNTFTLIDRSKAGLAQNGQPVPKDTFVPLHNGDRLDVAGVLTLEVLIQDDPDSCTVRVGPVEQSTPGKTEQLVLEATLGDMVTME